MINTGVGEFISARKYVGGGFAVRGKNEDDGVVEGNARSWRDAPTEPTAKLVGLHEVLGGIAEFRIEINVFMKAFRRTAVQVEFFKRHFHALRRQGHKSINALDSCKEELIQRCLKKMTEIFLKKMTFFLFFFN